VAHHKSAIKRHRQNEKRRLQNRVVKTRMKTVTKKLVMGRWLNLVSSISAASGIE